MQNFSKHFNLDILSDNQSLKPVIVIADSSNSILFIFTQDQLELFDNNGNEIDVINCLKNVSNIKASNDYDSKKIKINRLRCNFYNYYDIANKLSQYANDGLINKNLYLFYKSPTTNIINLSDNQGDYDCAFAYSGSISRINVNSKTIKITAEDSTQYKLSDKQIPYNSIDRLPEDIKENASQSYDLDDTVIPITYGNVNRAELFGTITDGGMKLYADTHPIEGIYQTSKIPEKLDNEEINDPNVGHIYVKSGDQWVSKKILAEAEDFFSAFRTYPYIRLPLDLLGENYVIPELNSSDYKTFTVFTHQRMVEQVYVFDNVSILDVLEATTEESSSNNYNITSINDNGGNDKHYWYRSMDNIDCNNENFDTGYGDADRVIILRLSRGVGLPLYGKSFFKCDWRMYQQNQQHQLGLGYWWPNEGDSPVGFDIAKKTGFWVTAISSEIYENWQNFMLAFETLAQTNPNIEEVNPLIFLNLLLISNQHTLSSWLNSVEELEELANEQPPQNVSFDSLYSYETNDELLNKSQIFLYQDEESRTSTGYWGNFVNDNGISSPPISQGIGGLYYGNSTEREEQANIHNTIAIFEAATTVDNDNVTIHQGLEINNFATEHNVRVESVENMKVYASVRGRRNYYFTEEIDSVLDFSQDFISSDIDEISLLINGSDETSPNTDLLLNAYYNTLSEYQFNAGAGSIADDFDYNTEYIMNLDDSLLIGNNHIFQTLISDTIESPYYLLRSLGADSYEAPAQSFGNILVIPDLNNPMEQFTFQEGNDLILNNMFAENIVKSSLKKIFEYLLQRDIDYEEDFTFQILTKPQLMEDGWWAGSWICTIETVNITEDINSQMLFNWDSFQEDIADGGALSYMQHFNTYIEDFKTALLTSLYDRIGSLVEQPNYVYNPTLIESVVSQTNNFNPYLPASDFDAWLGDYIISGGTNFVEFQTTGSIEKPSDIVMNLLTSEMEFGKRLENQQAGVDVVIPEYNNYDIESIRESREAHSNWKMGFCINKKQESKKLIENILKESKSYPRFTTEGRFGFMTIKESYTYNDIDKIIDIDDITSYEFTQTRRENIITSCTMFYRYDYGTNKHTKTLARDINDIFPDWSLTGYDYYNLESTNIDTKKDIQLKYHTEDSTVDDFMDYTLLNNCNVHNQISFALTLKYINLTVGDIIHFPLIENSKAFDIDYSKVDYLNGQPIYPLWIVMSVDINPNGVKINAVQLHYLGTDGNHGFQFPEETGYSIIGNMQEFNSVYTFTDGSPIPNWNYNPIANIDSGFEIPYFDLNNDGSINIMDLMILQGYVIGTGTLTSSQKEKLKYRSDGNLTQTDIIDIMSIVALLNIITSE